MNAQAEQVFPIFVGVWIVLVILSVALFVFNNNAAFKRKAWPPFVIFAGALFLGFVALMGFDWGTMLFVGPAVALITILNLRNVKFCDSCGKTVRNQSPFAAPKFCGHCGAKLDGQGTSSNV